MTTARYACNALYHHKSILNLHPIHSLVLVAVFFVLPPLSVSVSLVPLSLVALGCGPVYHIPSVQVTMPLVFQDGRR